MPKKKKRILSKEEKQIYKLLEFFLDFAAWGLLALFGQTEMPDNEEIIEMLYAKNGRPATENLHVQGGIKTTRAESMMERADTIYSQIRKFGGVENFRRAYKALEENDPDAHRILYLWSLKGKAFNTFLEMQKKYALPFDISSIRRIKDRGLETLTGYIASADYTGKGKIYYHKPKQQQAGKQESLF